MKMPAAERRPPCEGSRLVGSVKTSMLRDVGGRAIEIGPVVGALAHIADAVARPLPTIRLALLRLHAHVIST